MRNLKRALSLALAAAMLIGVMMVGAGAASSDFGDSAAIDTNRTEAVDVMTGLGIFEGDDNGNLNPDQILDRDEAAAIISRVILGVSNAAKLPKNQQVYDDVAAGSWAAGYIAYCSNMGILAGDGTGNFNPDDDLTGVQFGKMLLVAAGYDAAIQGYEYNADWDVNIANDMIVNGLDLDGELLSAPLTRENAIQMLFQALAMDTVTYTTGNVIGKIGPYQVTYTARDYDATTTTTDGTQQFAEKYFPDLTKTLGTADAWGRPCYYDWVCDDHNALTLNDSIHCAVMTPVVTYNTMVAECDIAHDIGFTTARPIEAAFIDGNSYAGDLINADITSNQYASINPYATTSMVGAQGRVTEVYDMGTDGLRLVEINTYLATVAAIVPESVDRNGHVIPAYSILTVYVDETNPDDETALVADATVDNMVTLYTSDVTNAVGSFVLVTANTTSVATPLNANAPAQAASVAPASVNAGGMIVSYVDAVDNTLAGATTLTATAYKDADKLVLINTPTGTKAANLANGPWQAVTDAYGNLIGLVPSATNYLVIEGIRWIDAPNGIFGGYAMADVVLSTGAKVSGAKISMIKTVAANNAEILGTPANGVVSDSETLNTDYYNHIWSYSVNADGTYNLIDDVCVTNAGNVTPADHDVTGDLATQTPGVIDITNGIVTINGNTNLVVANDNTVFLLKDKTATGYGYTYTTYVGKNNVPNVVDANAHWLVNTNTGYADLVVISLYTSPADVFAAYIPDNAPISTVNVAGNPYYYYNVYKLGETTPTVIMSANNPLVADGAEGFYTVTVTNGVATVSSVVMAAQVGNLVDTTAAVPETISGGGYHAGMFKALVGNSLQMTNVDGTTAYLDFWADNAQFILVTDYQTGIVVSAGYAAQLVDDTEIVVFDAVTADDTLGVYKATYVYILKAGTVDVGGDAADTVSIVAADYDTIDINYTNNDSVNAKTVDVTWQYRLKGDTAWKLHTVTTGETAAAGTTTPLTSLDFSGYQSTETYEFRAVVTDNATGAVLATSNIVELYG